MKHTRVSNCFKMPNVISNDALLTYTAKRVAATLYSWRNALGFCRLGLRKLALYSDCSVATVRDALARLEASGYISTYRNYAWSAEHGRSIRRRDTIICRIATKTNFTFVPRAALRVGMKKSSFAVYLLIRRLAGNVSRAFPSLRRIADSLGMGLSTVCRALKELHSTSLLHCEHCIKRSGAHTSNSYFLVHTADTQYDSESIKPMEQVITPVPSVAVRAARQRAQAQRLPVWLEQVAFPLPVLIISSQPP